MTIGSTTEPADLRRTLPAGWRDRTIPVLEGRALCLLALGRPDFLKVKLFALCDRGLDLVDCLALAPNASELAEATEWVEQQDAHPGWPDHVRATLEDLSRRLGHGI
jgi:hypothetical protein